MSSKEKKTKKINLPLSTIPIVDETGKKEWDGIGISGTNTDVQKFKGLCKYHGFIVGEEVLKFVKQFNEKNKI